MAQLIYNTMRFGTDNFNIIEEKRTALLIAKEPLVKNFEWNILEKFIIDANIPAGTDVRFAFTTDVENRKDQIFILTNNGANHIAMETLINPDSWLGVSAYTVDDITADIVLENGNTITSLQALNGLELASGNIEAKRRLFPVIAVKATGNKAPKVKMSVKVSNRQPKTEHESTRAVGFDNLTKIIALTPEIKTTGNATATVTAAYKTAADGEYSDFAPVKNLVGKNVYGIKFKRQINVSEVDGSDKAEINVYGKFTEDVECPVFGDYADIYSITKNYYLPLKYCVVVVKHAELSGARIKAFVKTAPSILSAISRQLGTGTGSQQTFSLPASGLVDVSTLQVYINGTQTYNYNYRVEQNELTITAPAGANITASFHYKHFPEEWIELTADATQHDISDGKFTTRFYSKITDTDAYVSAVRLRLFRAPENPEQTLTLPLTPTGEEQSYKLGGTNLSLLSFDVKKADGTTAYAYRSTLTLPLHDDFDGAVEHRFNTKTSTITFTVPAGNYSIEIGYKKISPAPKIYSWTAGWCV